jgi:hypothetical protein
LSEREALPVLGLGEPATLLDEVALHVTDQRDRPAKT